MNTRKKIQLSQERKLVWIGSSLDDVQAFPEPVARAVLTALEVARLGGKHDSAKPWKGERPGVFEIVIDDGDAYRAVYTVRFKEAICVIHAFQKKSTQGIKTPEREIEIVSKRLKRAAADYEVRYGRKKN
jgi:phage-related protein